MDPCKGLEHLRTLVIDAANDEDPEQDPENDFEESAGIKNLLSLCRHVVYFYLFLRKPYMGEFIFLSIHTFTIFSTL